MNKLYWHFLTDDGRLLFGTREKVEVGKMLTLPEGVRPIPCKLGFHASERAIDALSHAPGGIICQVSLHGEIIPHGNPIDKHVGWGRTVVSMADANSILREFARWCALSVIDLWEPEQVVVDYLNTGDERLKEAACASASASANARASFSASASVSVSASASACASASVRASVSSRASDSASASANARASFSASAYASAVTAQNKKLEDMLFSLLSERK